MELQSVPLVPEKFNSLEYAQKEEKDRKKFQIFLDTLCGLGTSIFAEESVRAYMEQRRSSTGVLARYPRIASAIGVVIFSMMIISSSLVSGVVLLAVTAKIFGYVSGFSWIHFLTACGSLLVSFALFLALNSRKSFGARWEIMDYSRYKETHFVPRDVRESADQIKWHLPSAKLCVHYLGADPFLSVIDRNSGVELFIKVWDEEEFPTGAGQTVTDPNGGK